MMRNIAIGLAAATIAIGGSTLSSWALYGQESGINKRMSGSVQGEHGKAVARERADLTPLQRERLKGIARERVAKLTPRQRRHLRGTAGDVAEREHLNKITGGHYAQLTWLQRSRLRRITRDLGNLTPQQRERVREIMREGPYGRR